MKSLMVLLRTQYCSGDQIKKDEVAGTCSMHGENRGVGRVLVGNLRERDHLEDPGVDGMMIILRWIFRK